MIHLAWPFVLLVLPLPWLVRRFLQPVQAPGSAALRVPDVSDFLATNQAASRGPAPWAVLLALAGAWLALVGAAARPQWLGEPLDVPVSGRDLMIAVDLSQSMREQDFRIGDDSVDRLTATKHVAGDFISRREGDRIGLILFGEQAFLQVPLTFDRDTVKTLLDESVIALAGRRTAIGDAIGLAVKRLRESDFSDQVLVLLTDGANTAGNLDPRRAAELAASEGLTIYTIGIGAANRVVQDFFGRRIVTPGSELDEKLLTDIADATGGRYFRARDMSELESIYAELDRIEPVEKDVEKLRPVKALYPWPLGVAMVLSALAFTLVRLQR